jgi:hypothetical protein
VLRPSTRRLAAVLALLLPLLAGVRLIPHAPTPTALRSSPKGPRKCVSERAETSCARAVRAEGRRVSRSPLVLETARAGTGVEHLRLDPAILGRRATDWDREPRALKLCLARDSHSTLAPPCL